MFAAAVSLVTGKILYISDQVASVFHCKRDVFYGARFVEFLAPHDVRMFHASTTPYRLPPWSVCGGAGEGLGRWPSRAAWACAPAAGGTWGLLPSQGGGPGWPTPGAGRGPAALCQSPAGTPAPRLTQPRDGKLLVQDKLRRVVFSQISERETHFRRL